MENQVEQEVERLKRRIAELEQENRSFQYLNVELCKAVNERKYKKMLNMLLKQYETEEAKEAAEKAA